VRRQSRKTETGVKPPRAKAVKGHRLQMLVFPILRSRFGALRFPKPKTFGETSVEKSLQRLGTDYIDLYQVHGWDILTPIEETLRALDDLVRQGKVRYIGCSNWSARHLMKALYLSRAHDWAGFVSLQAYYSLVGRDLEHELLPLSREESVGVLPWSPLSGGFLSGKYRRDNPNPEGARRTGFQFRRLMKRVASMRWKRLSGLRKRREQRSLRSRLPGCSLNQASPQSSSVLTRCRSWKTT
jgi:aryl-alcohol dehydrogenase-like predicted oxidoreductase